MNVASHRSVQYCVAAIASRVIYGMYCSSVVSVSYHDSMSDRTLSVQLFSSLQSSEYGSDNKEERKRYSTTVTVSSVKCCIASNYCIS